VRVLVTGAAGFAGSHLCEFLLSQGVEIYGLVMPGGSLENLQQIRANPEQADRLRIRETDIVDGEGLVATIADIRPDRVYHLAAVSSVRQSLEDPAEAFLVNTLGTRNLLEAVRRVGVKPRMLVISSAEAYGASANLPRPLREEDPLLPVSPYGASKAAAEMVASRYIKEFNLDIVRVRPFPHSGPRQATQFVFSNWAQQLAQIEAGRQPPRLQVGNLDVRRDLSDVRDVVKAYSLALERGQAGAVYNICSGRVYSLQAILRMLVDLSPVKVEITADPERVRPQDLQVLAGTPQALRALAGWEAVIPLSQTLGDLLHYWRGRQTATSPTPCPPEVL